MQQIINNLADWRKTRNIREVNLKIKDDLMEEYKEALAELQAGNIEKYVVELSDICIFGLNWLGLLRVEYKYSKINAPIGDVVVYSLMQYLEENIDSIRIEHFTGTAFMIKDTVDVCFYLAELQGYDMEKVILEKIKVISSREQDPQQKKDWLKNGAKGKWLKNENQDPDSIYVGDFDTCKV